MDLSKPKLVFVSPFVAKAVIEVCKDLSYVENVILIDGKSDDDFTISLSDLIKKHENIPFSIDEFVKGKVDMEDQVALIMCSSGTMGLPKGVQITQKNMNSVIDSYRALFEVLKIIHEEEKLVILNISPWFHAMGFMAQLMVACTGDSIYVFLPKYENEKFLGSIEVGKFYFDNFLFSTKFSFFRNTKLVF